MSNACDPVRSDSACNGLFGPQLRLSSVLQPKSYGPRTLRRWRTSEGAQCTPQQRAPILSHPSTRQREVSNSTLPGPPRPPQTRVAVLFYRVW